MRVNTMRVRSTGGLAPRCGHKQRCDRWEPVEIAMLRELSEKGLRPCEMAAFFPHRSGADTIRAQLRKNGIVTNGKAPPPEWTPDEDATLRRLWLAGAKLSKILEALPRRSRFSIASRRDRLGLSIDLRKRAAVDGAQIDPDEWPSDDPIGTSNMRPAPRRCLGCRNEFESQGPHHRRCGPCATLLAERDTDLSDMGPEAFRSPTGGTPGTHHSLPGDGFRAVPWRIMEDWSRF